MPQTPHMERHFTASEMVRDVVIGMADGLTVPFALAAGRPSCVNPFRYSNISAAWSHGCISAHEE